MANKKQIPNVIIHLASILAIFNTLVVAKPVIKSEGEISFNIKGSLGQYWETGYSGFTVKSTDPYRVGIIGTPVSLVSEENQDSKLNITYVVTAPDGTLVDIPSDGKLVVLDHIYKGEYFFRTRGYVNITQISQYRAGAYTGSIKIYVLPVSK